jgi:hypothetical protein
VWAVALLTTGAGVENNTTHEAKLPVSNPPFVTASTPIKLLLKTIVVMAAPEQDDWDAGVAIATGIGFTVMVNNNGVPKHPSATGTTVIVATIGPLPALVAVNEGTFPMPFAASPMDGVVLTHAKAVPAIGPVRDIAAVIAPWQ